MDFLRSELHRKVVHIKLNKTKCDTTSNVVTDCEVWAEGDSKIFLGEKANFLMRTPTPDLLSLQIRVTDQHKREIEVSFCCKTENIHEVSFCPADFGVYTMEVFWDGHAVQGSPFTVDVMEKLD